MVLVGLVELLLVSNCFTWETRKVRRVVKKCDLRGQTDRKQVQTKDRMIMEWVPSLKGKQWNFKSDKIGTMHIIWSPCIQTYNQRAIQSQTTFSSISKRQLWRTATPRATVWKLHLWPLARHSPKYPLRNALRPLTQKKSRNKVEAQNKGGKSECATSTRRKWTITLRNSPRYTRKSR